MAHQNNLHRQLKYFLIDLLLQNINPKLFIGSSQKERINDFPD
jgi:hypothetical protein